MCSLNFCCDRWCNVLLRGGGASCHCVFMQVCWYLLHQFAVAAWSQQVHMSTVLALMVRLQFHKLQADQRGLCLSNAMVLAAKSALMMWPSLDVLTTNFKTLPVALTFTCLLGNMLKWHLEKQTLCSNIQWHMQHTSDVLPITSVVQLCIRFLLSEWTYLNCFKPGYGIYYIVVKYFNMILS